MIKQTLLGRVLCRLGLHLPVIGGWSWPGHTEGVPGPGSVWGGCVRCNAGWQWDNPNA